MSARCIEWGEETRKECAEYRDEGYNKCSDWDKDCCDWWPCSWGCKIISWVCVAWYWVSNIVCVAWTYITEAVCLAWEAIVTIAVYIIGVIEFVVGAIISFVDFILEVILSIPILGAIIRWVLNIVKEIVWRIVGIFDALAWLIGIRPEKKLRMCVLLLTDEKKNPVANEADVLEEVRRAAEIFREQANVRLVPVSPASFDTPFHGDDIPDDSYIHLVESGSDDSILDVSCGAGALGNDLWLRGSTFNILMTRNCFWGNARRLLGYGAPVAVFVVRTIDGSNTTGCSLGPLTDYITVRGSETADRTTIAHETGHACGLWHHGTATNLMFGTDSDARREMTNFQAINFRNSRHVTYF